MTSTSVPAASPAVPAAPPVVLQRTRVRGRIPGLRVASTPRTLALAMVGLTLLSLAWGAVGAWTAADHASAAADVVSTREPASLQARQMYQSLSDADVTATSAFLSGPQQTLTARQRYQADIAQAGASLSALKSSASADDPALAASLSAISQGLPVYASYVAQAQSDYALGYQLTGGSFMQVASEQMHLTLLPAARQVNAAANASLDARSAQASGLPWIVVVLVVSVVLGFWLLRTQHWLSGRTRRTVNYGLAGATLALVAATLWLLAGSLIARSHLNDAEVHGSRPVESLAQATITAQRARGDEILNLISRTGASSFQSDAQAARKELGPLLTGAASASAVNASGPLPPVGDDAKAWYAAEDKVFSLDVAASYRAETALVIGSGAGSSGALFAALQSDLGKTIAVDQAVFQDDARAGAGAYDGLAVGIAIAAVLMAAGCIWGLSKRLAEYR